MTNSPAQNLAAPGVEGWPDVFMAGGRQYTMTRVRTRSQVGRKFYDRVTARFLDNGEVWSGGEGAFNAYLRKLQTAYERALANPQEAAR